MLKWALAHRKTMVTICLVAVLSIVPLFGLAGVNFLPEEDESQFEITLRAPEGTSLAATHSVMERIARDVREQLTGIETHFDGGRVRRATGGQQRDDIRSARPRR